MCGFELTNNQLILNLGIDETIYRLRDPLRDPFREPFWCLIMCGFERTNNLGKVPAQLLVKQPQRPAAQHQQRVSGIEEMEYQKQASCIIVPGN